MGREEPAKGPRERRELLQRGTAENEFGAYYLSQNPSGGMEGKSTLFIDN